MKIDIRPMNQTSARTICTWEYEEPYDLYNLTIDDVEELLNGTYFSAHGNNGLIGFFCFGQSAIVPCGLNEGVYDDSSYLDIGLGLRPDLCSKGLGKDFMLRGIHFGKENFKNDQFRLTVASFNKRAITLYKKVGFNLTQIFHRTIENESLKFKVMQYVMNEKIDRN